MTLETRENSRIEKIEQGFCPGGRPRNDGSVSRPRLLWNSCTREEPCEDLFLVIYSQNVRHFVGFCLDVLREENILSHDRIYRPIFPK